MTREHFEEAKLLIREIDVLKDVAAIISVEDEIYLAPKKVEMDGGYSNYLKSQYKFSGELKQRIVATIRGYIDDLEGELSDL